VTTTTARQLKTGDQISFRASIWTVAGVDRFEAGRTEFTLTHPTHPEAKMTLTDDLQVKVPDAQAAVNEFSRPADAQPRPRVEAPSTPVAKAPAVAAPEVVRCYASSKPGSVSAAKDEARYGTPAEAEAYTVTHTVFVSGARYAEIQADTNAYYPELVAEFNARPRVAGYQALRIATKSGGGGKGRSFLVDTQGYDFLRYILIPAR